MTVAFFYVIFEISTYNLLVNYGCILCLAALQSQVEKNILQRTM